MLCGDESLIRDMFTEEDEKMRSDPDHGCVIIRSTFLVCTCRVVVCVGCGNPFGDSYPIEHTHVQHRGTILFSIHVTAE